MCLHFAVVHVIDVQKKKKSMSGLRAWSVFCVHVDFFCFLRKKINKIWKAVLNAFIWLPFKNKQKTLWKVFFFLTVFIFVVCFWPTKYYSTFGGNPTLLTTLRTPSTTWSMMVVDGASLSNTVFTWSLTSGGQTRVVQIHIVLYCVHFLIMDLMALHGMFNRWDIPKVEPLMEHY